LPKYIFPQSQFIQSPNLSGINLFSIKISFKQEIRFLCYCLSFFIIFDDCKAKLFNALNCVRLAFQNIDSLNSLIVCVIFLFYLLSLWDEFYIYYIFHYVVKRILQAQIEDFFDVCLYSCMIIYLRFYVVLIYCCCNLNLKILSFLP
jgi:hypothetical protein